jgi:retinol dehydrogenase 12
MALSYVWYILRNGLGQQFFVPPAPLTEKNLPDQTNRVFMITGGYAGVGQEVASILYGANGTVWIVGRSESKAAAAEERIKAEHPGSSGKLHFLKVDLSDLTTIKPAVEDFKRRNESGKLHWLNNNAGVMT